MLAVAVALPSTMHAALITSTAFTDDSTSAFVTSSGNIGIGLHSNGANYMIEGSESISGNTIDRWTKAYELSYSGGVWSGGKATKNRRGILTIMGDGSTTVGLINVSLDVAFAGAVGTDFVTLELYGFNDGGDTFSPELSWGGPVGGTAWNDTRTGTATTLIDTTFNTAGTQTVSDVDLGAGGYDYYMWRVGLSASSTTNVSFSDLSVTVVPEPSSAALLGLGGLALIFRRRK